MKINELREGIFDRSTQSSIANFGKVAAKQWNIYKQNLQRKNDFQPVNKQDLQQHLQRFIKDNILVNYDIGPNDRNEEAIIVGMMGKILGTDDINQQSASFATIADQARKLGVRGDTPRTQMYEPFEYDAAKRVYKLNDKEFRADDPAQMALVKQISQQAQQA